VTHHTVWEREKRPCASPRSVAAIFCYMPSPAHGRLPDPHPQSLWSSVADHFISWETSVIFGGKEGRLLTTRAPPALKPATSGSAAAFQSAKKYHQRPPSPRGSPIELVNSCASSAASSTATSVVAAVATAAIAAGPPPRSPSSATSVRVFFLLCCRLRAAAPRSSPVAPLLS
jgi:hypothetical protein